MANATGKAMNKSYVESLAMAIFGAMVIVSQSSGQDMPFGFGQSEWLLVANALWLSLIPVVRRYLDKMDPAFGRVAASLATEAGKKLAQEASKAKKKK